MMEFADIVLYLIYLVFTLAIASVLWALYRRNRRGAGRESVQNGVRIRLINFLVWALLLVVVIVSNTVSDGSIAGTMIYAIETMLLLSLLSIVWALLKRR